MRVLTVFDGGAVTLIDGLVAWGSAPDPGVVRGTAPVSDDAGFRAAAREAAELGFDDAAAVLMLFPVCVSRTFSIGVGNGKRFGSVSV